MASKSAAPAVKLALKNLLAARAGLATVQVSYGQPFPPNSEYVWVGGIKHAQQAAGIRGAAPRPREETFTIDVFCSVLDQGGVADHQTPTERAYALAAEVEDAIRADMTINSSLGNGWAEIAELELEERGPDQQGLRESEVTVRVRCRARI